MRYYFFILAAVALLALQFSTNKAYGLRRGDGAKASLIFGTACGFASALITFVIDIKKGTAGNGCHSQHQCCQYAGK